MLYTDMPIHCKSEDQLERNSFAETFAKALINFKNSDTFTIGLFGKWGSGKTSLVNLILVEINELQKHTNKDDKLLIIHFEPWNFTDTNQLLSQFFIRLSNEFRSQSSKNLQRIGEALDKYSSAFELAKFIPKAGEAISIIGKKGAPILGKQLKQISGENDILKQKENVIKLLQKQENKTLVIIDDIDRLSNEQIRQIFQLITSVAKFPNTIYLLVFDKEIVVKALEKVQEGNGEDYLEKIIQMPIQIPEVRKNKLYAVLADRLDKIIENDKNVSLDMQHWENISQKCILPFVESIREINRLCNSVQFKLTAIASEVDFTDMVAISVIEIYFPTVYEWIKNNKSILTGELDFSFGNNKSQSELYDMYYKEVQQLLPNSTLKDDVKTVIDALINLFPYFGQKIGKVYQTYDLNTLRKKNLIAHPEKFNRYFSLDLNQVGLRNHDIKNAIFNLDSTQLHYFILRQERNNHSYEFFQEVYSRISEISIERSKIIIEAILYSAKNIESSSQTSLFNSSTRSIAERIILDLADIIPKNDRMSFLKTLINTASLETLPSLANVINMLELSYGRLAAEGKERDGYPKIITLEELLNIETYFVQIVKDILEDNSIFDFYEWRLIFYLLECFDAEYTSSYLETSFSDPQNILKFLANSISVWSGSGTSYEVSDAYTKYLTKERILEAIQKQLDSGEFWNLSIPRQNTTAAFYLHNAGVYGYNGNVSQVDVDELLGKWKTSLETKGHLS